MIREESFWFFVVLENAFESWSNLFWKSEKKIGLQALTIVFLKKIFFKNMKRCSAGLFLWNFKVAYRGKFLIFFNAWKCARKLKCSILIMSKKIGMQALTNVFLKKKTICKKTFFQIFFQNIFFKSTFASACAPFFHDIIKI